MGKKNPSTPQYARVWAHIIYFIFLKSLNILVASLFWKTLH